MNMLNRAIIACIAATVFAGGITPTSAQVVGGGKECDTVFVIDAIMWDEYGPIYFGHFETTCVEIIDDEQAQ